MYYTHPPCPQKLLALKIPLAPSTKNYHQEMQKVSYCIITFAIVKVLPESVTPSI